MTTFNLNDPDAVAALMADAATLDGSTGATGGTGGDPDYGSNAGGAGAAAAPPRMTAAKAGV
jgi:hypothetical protein